MNQPKVSIIVPIYNVEKYLDRCVQSLLHQTLKDIEIILVDDGSPDNCPIMCDEYAKQDARIKVIHKQNAGLGMARNSGIEIATGEYISFIDSDDYVGETMYEKLHSKAKQDNLEVCYCNVQNFDDNGNCGETVNRYDNDKFYSKEEIELLSCHMLAAPISSSLLVEIPNIAWNGIYLMDRINNSRMRFKSERIFVSEDVLFHAEYLHLFKRIGWLNEKLVYHYLANSSSLTHNFSMKKSIAILNMAKKISEVTPKYCKDVDYKSCLHGYLLNLYSSSLFNICTMNIAYSQRIQNALYFTKEFKKVSNIKRFIKPFGRLKLYAFCYNKCLISFLAIYYTIRNGILAKLYHSIFDK